VGTPRAVLLAQRVGRARTTRPAPAVKAEAPPEAAQPGEAVVSAIVPERSPPVPASLRARPPARIPAGARRSAADAYQPHKRTVGNANEPALPTRASVERELEAEPVRDEASFRFASRRRSTCACSTLAGCRTCIHGRRARLQRTRWAVHRECPRSVDPRTCARPLSDAAH